jgi:hypothetical protein
VFYYLHRIQWRIRHKSLSNGFLCLDGAVSYGRTPELCSLLQGRKCEGQHRVFPEQREQPLLFVGLSEIAVF